MRFIPTRVHGFMDYAISLVLIIAPWVLGFARNGAETWVPVVLGIGSIGYSLCTRYELGVMPILSMPTHLWMDFVSGLFLAVSPWLFGFAAAIWAPHLVLGLVEIGASLMTRTVPEQAPLASPRVESRRF